jgi:hypothetical protein
VMIDPTLQLETHQGRITDGPQELEGGKVSAIVWINLLFNVFQYPCSTGSLNLCNKINKCTCIQHVSSHTINYEHVWTAFAIIIRVALQEF